MLLQRKRSSTIPIMFRRQFTSQPSLLPCLTHCLVLYLAVFLHTSTCISAQLVDEVDCNFQGSTHLTGSSWKTDPCTACRCTNGIATCELEKCKNPYCKETESLRIPPNSCCPVCVQSIDTYCRANGKIIAHGTLWEDTERCQTCTCHNGVIDCESVKCLQLACGYGKIVANVTGECCPLCASVEDSCAYEGKTYEDGASWSPLPCERAVCSKGEVVRLVASCPNMVCSSDESLQLVDGQCCPSCVGASCLYQGRHLSSGKTVQKNECERCVCQAGALICEEKNCNKVPSCDQDQLPATVDGECCGICVSERDTCYVNGTTRYHGDLWWNSADDDCRIEYCDEGVVRGDVLQCSPVVCNWNETLVNTSCCPACLPVSVHCYHNAMVYRKGDEWQNGLCEKCECLNIGQTQCYKAECPSCPSNTTAVTLQGDCCSICRPVTCHESCSECDDEGYGKCTACPSNRLLQEGRCVRRCMDGFYQEKNICKPCTSTCSRCNQHVCLSCETPLLLQDGKCVNKCEEGFYHHQSSGECAACQKTCQRCTNDQECLQCYKSTNVVQGGTCVPDCEEAHFYDANGTCSACHPSCKTCSKQWDTCDACQVGWILMDGLCVEKCPKSWFQVSILRCAPCHSSCESCRSATSSSCVTCHHGFSLYRNTCVKNCPSPYYNEAGVCRECDETCRTCVGASADECTSCMSNNMFISSINNEAPTTTNGTCVTECPVGRYLDGEGFCKECHATCVSCVDPYTCTSCRAADDEANDAVLTIASQGEIGLCTSRQSCQRSELSSSDATTGLSAAAATSNTAAPTMMFCFNRTSMARCTEQSLLSFGDDACTETCPTGSFLLTVESGLDTCVRCQRGCTKCSKHEECEQCQEGLFLSAISDRCVASCEVGFYNPVTGPRCLRCPETCSSCKVEQSQGTPVCTSCFQPNSVIQIDQCVPSCVPQFYADYSDSTYGENAICKACDWSCTSCSGPSNSECLECMPDKYLQAGHCLTECTQGFYASNERCLPCSDKNCQACEEDGVCTFCELDFYLLDSKCVRTCPRSFFSDATWQICRACPQHCLTCADRDTCLQCDEESFLNHLASNSTAAAGQSSRALSRRIQPCKRRCDRGFYGNHMTRRCEKQRKMRNISINGPLVVGVGSRVCLDDIVSIPRNAKYRSDLRVHIVMQSVNGWFEIDERKLNAGDFVSYKNLDKVWFVHDEESQLQNGVAVLKLKANGFTDYPKFNLQTVAISTHPPKITKNKALIVNSGETVKITSQYLEIADDDSRAAEVSVSVVNPAQHGKIVKLPNYDEAVSLFTLSDLHADVIAYVSDSEVLDTEGFRSDAAMLQVTDGYHVINLVVRITEVSTVKAKPTLITNNVIHITRGGFARITPTQLLTVAPGIKDKSKIVYVIEEIDEEVEDEEGKTKQSSAELVMMVPTLSDAPMHYGAYPARNDWYLNNQGLYQTRALQRMTQSQVDNGYIWVRHNPSEEGDRMKPVQISVYDESTRPSTRIARSNLKISLSRDNNEAPRPSRNTAVGRSLLITDTTRVNVLHNGYLQYVDPDTADMDIIYNITRPLPTRLGTIEHADHPYVPLLMFTQADVDANKIMYRPPSSRMPRSPYTSSFMSNHYYMNNGQIQPLQQSGYNSGGSTPLPREFTFTFTVSDGKHFLPAKNFTFQVDENTRENEPPTFIHQYPVLGISRDGTASIGTPQLAIRDPDTSPKDLVFSLLNAPSHGDIIKTDEEGEVKLNRGDEFTYDDVRTNQLKYSYHGGNGPRSDQFQISVSDGSHLLAKVIQVSISAVDHHGPEPDRLSEISVVMPANSEKTLTRENLAYVDQDSTDNEIVYHLESAANSGELEHKLKGYMSTGDIFTQSDINNGFIKFTSSQDAGMATLTDVIRFSVADKLGNRIPRQLLAITIMPVRYHAPTVEQGREIQIVSGSKIEITPEHIVVHDQDTDSSNIEVVIDSPPNYGTIIAVNEEAEPNTDNDSEGIVLFTLNDVINGNILYKAAPKENYFENVTDSFVYHVTDGRAVSIEQKVDIIVLRAIKPSPVLHLNSISCPIGRMVRISNSTLSVDDVTTPSDQLVITIDYIPKNGRVVRLLPEEDEDGDDDGKEKLSVGSIFTYQDIIDGRICYETLRSDGSYRKDPIRRIRRDALGFTLSNGFHRTSGEVEIDVEPVVEVPVVPVTEKYYDASPPTRSPITNDDDDDVDQAFVVVTNSALQVERGSTSTITSSNLRVSGPSPITYRLTRDPSVGVLQLIDITNNEIINVTAESDEHNTFTQKDINSGFLKYSNIPASEESGDLYFHFDVVGGELDQTFYINVREDNSKPRIITNVGLVVKEGERFVLTTHQLSATDESGHLLYDVIESPDLGRLELVENPGQSIDHFDQNDLRGGRVQFVHTSDTEETEDQIVFAVTDGKNSIMQTFFITILPVDNSLPVIENSGIRVQEGVRKTITEVQLKAEDADTNANLVTFVITSAPLHGLVERSSSRRHYLPVTSFTMNDIYDNRISYRHDGSNSLTDRFYFTVNDGTNSQFIVDDGETQQTTNNQQEFSIEVAPVDDGTPRLITNLGLNHLEYENGVPTGYITRRSLSTEDPDTAAKSIIYSITSMPKYGHLEVLRDGGHYERIDSFTQADIDAGAVRYMMDVDETSLADTRDSFMFDVRDSHPNYVTGNSFIIRWSLISFKKAVYTAKEEAGTIEIEVTRVGNLNQYAIVLCSTKNGTATSSDRTGGDYLSDAGQVQFDEHETEKHFSIQIHDDPSYEGIEYFYVELSLPTYSLLGKVSRAKVEIDDVQDKPVVQFMESTYSVDENNNFLSIPIKRSGDLTKKVSVLCYTESRSAKGSATSRIQTGSDFISRHADDSTSFVTFQPGKTIAACEVQIIDDSKYEDSEDFIVKIAHASQGALIGDLSEIKVTIAGPNDAPVVFLANSMFTFYENDGAVDVQIYRSGTDLSFPTDVWCSTKETTPISAVADEDFVRKSTKVTFLPEETVKVCTLTIMDDSQTPEVEGDETFIVDINSAVNAHISEPSEALVVINDTLNDVPTMSFTKTNVEVKESVGVVSLEIRRTGDLNDETSVLCYTEEGFANDESDFIERPETEFSRVIFRNGQTVAECNVTIVDDLIHEANENFVVRLGSPRGNKNTQVLIGASNRVTVTITNKEDAPTLQFGKTEYFVREPSSTEESKQVMVRVVRTGDVSKISKVRCSTRDGSAKSGSDYEPRSKILRFQPGTKEVTFQVNIMSNEDTEWHNTFLVVLGPQDPVNAILGDNSQTTVTILDKNAAGSLILPLPPLLVSLLHYDDVKSGVKTDPSPGYPLVCVTPCDPKHPDYVDTQSLCEEAAINVSSIRFAWEVAMPTDEVDGVPPFERVTDVTPFTSVDHKVLDSIYFGRRFNIRCVAMVVDWVTNTPGTPLRSNVVKIGTENGLCHNPIESGSERSFQAQSCIANLEYIGPGDKKHGNSLHVSVKVPHQDGRLPLISTMPFNNLKRLLSRSIDRHQHVCSNLMYSDDQNNKTLSKKSLGTNLGFISQTDYSKLTFGPGFDKPYQFDPAVRESKTIDLYKYLNLKSCVWQFDTHYHMNELIDNCNGKVSTDYQMRDTAESQVTVTVPLYVSYVYVTAPRGWGALDHRTVMEVNFRYENVLWRTGIQTDGVLSGRIQVLRIKIRDDGKLVIEFKTQAKFRGLFVVSHRTFSEQKSQLLPPEGMNIGFTLRNVWSEKTYDSPYQIWEAVSTYSRKDYSGEYQVELLPCTVSSTQKWESVGGGDIQCTAYAPEKFQIPIMFQQTNRPVPVVYTLETKFQLCNNDQVFMMNPNEQKTKVNYDYKGAFTKGQTIYGRVLWNPQQDLKGAYRLQLEKVYLCTGRDGYVPYFDPTGTTYGGEPEYGCIEPSKKLKHRFLLLDRSNRRAEQRYFHDVPFDAYFASDKPEFAEMSEMNGVDGFLMKVDALYKVEAGHQWYMQVLYVIGPESMQPRFRRSAMYEFESGSRRMRRSSDDELATIYDSKNPKNGTNMLWLSIDETQLHSGISTLAIALIVLTILLLVTVTSLKLWCVVARRRKKEADDVIGYKCNVDLDVMTSSKKETGLRVDCEKSSGMHATESASRRAIKANLLPTANESCKVRTSNYSSSSLGTAAAEASPLLTAGMKSRTQQQEPKLNQAKCNNNRGGASSSSSSRKDDGAAVGGRKKLARSPQRTCNIKIVDNLHSAGDHDSGTEV